MYPIKVSSRTEITRKQKKTLKHYGLVWNGSEFNDLIKSERKIGKIKAYCKNEGLNFKISNCLELYQISAFK